ncbi:RIB43A-domain-containing protein [Pavlovales sp. CCMP2436]|nr:RIB43A-domain-containing protein [Pavlovales sp. CCMP2436]
MLSAGSVQDAVLYRRKEIEAIRLTRLNDKSYKVGIDTSVLGSQIADKTAAKLEEAVSDAAFDDMRLNVDKHLMFVDQQRDAYLRHRGQEVDAYRSEMQRTTDRREYDLNDPNALKNEAPARSGDEDPNASVSGLQKFAGEDLHYGQRVKMQQAQLQQWATAQAAEKRAKADAEKQTNAMWANHMLEADLLRCEFADKESEILRQRRTELAEWNLSQAQLKQSMLKEGVVQAEIDNATEIQVQLNSGWLGEDPALTRSFVQPHRVRPDHFKGMSAAQKQAILDENARLFASKQAAAVEEADLDKRIDDMTMQWNRVATLQEHEVEQRRAAMRKSIMHENEIAASTSKAAYSTLYNETYKNEVDDDFYKRFGTSAR